MSSQTGMRGKWAAGIKPRFFTWVIKDKLAVCERPGGYARNHRKVRRREEILWIKAQGFNRVVSLLPSPHNLYAYEEQHLASSHVPFASNDDPIAVLPGLYERLRWWLRDERVVVHQEEVNDRLMGVVAGYLNWGGFVPEGAQAIAVVERLFGRQMGPEGREIVTLVPVFPKPRRATAAAEGVEADVTEADVTEADVTEADATEAPATEAHATEAPATEAHAGEADA
jgi:hypothetical protein